MSEASLIDGRTVAATLRNAVSNAVARMVRQHGLQPGLTVIQVGDDPASSVYVRNKGEQTQAAGMRSDTRRLPADVTQPELLALISALNGDPAVHGILVQLPLPPHLDTAAVLAVLDPDKDVDGLTTVNAGRLANGVAGLVPCTPLGCMRLLRSHVGEIAGARAVVVGRSILVGKPVAQLLLAADCTVTLAHSRTRDLPDLCREADILIAAVGRPEMVRGAWIKPGAAVLDVGINRVPARDPDRAAEGKTRLVGDVAFEEARAVAGWLTPVPGGVGPMTPACLLMNTVTAACRQHGLASPFD